MTEAEVTEVGVTEVEVTEVGLIETEMKEVEAKEARNLAAIEVKIENLVLKSKKTFIPHGQQGNNNLNSLSMTISKPKR